MDYLPTSNMKLSDLPEDILLEVAKYLYLNCINFDEVDPELFGPKFSTTNSNTLDFRDSLQPRSTKTLVNFALTCRFIYSVLSPYIWYSIHLERPEVQGHPESTKCDINMHRMWSYGLSTSYGTSASSKPVRSVHTISWNMLQNVKIFSSCKCSFGVIKNAPSELNDLNGNFNQDVPYSSWVNLIDPKYMPNLRRIEACLLSTNTTWDARVLREALLTKYPNHSRFDQIQFPSIVRLAFRIQFCSLTIVALNDMGPEVLLLVQSLVITNTNKSGLPILNENAYNAIKLMKNLEHFALEPPSSSLASSVPRRYLAHFDGPNGNGRARSERRVSSTVVADKLIEISKTFKHLRQLELPSWHDFQRPISFELLGMNPLTELTCDMDHLYRIARGLPIESKNILRYPIFESLQSLEVFIPQHKDSTLTYDQVCLSQLRFSNLKRLLCFTDRDTSPLTSQLIRDNAETLQILHVSRVNIQDILYLFKCSKTTLKMLFVEEFEGFRTNGVGFDSLADGGLSSMGKCTETFFKDLRKLYTKFKDQKQLERLVLPVMKYSSNRLLVERYIARRCLQLEEVWFVSSHKIPRKKVLMTDDPADIVNADSSSGYQVGGSSYEKLQSSLDQFLSERYIKHVFTSLPRPALKEYKRKKAEISQPHIRIDGTEWEKNSAVVSVLPRIRHMSRPWAIEALYRCNLNKWRKDLEDDYMSRTLRSMVSSRLK